VQVSDDPRVGTELAGYRIESLLGWGGMSVVYLAEDRRLHRKVALKLLAADLAEDASFRDRFMQESELAASIDHPNIVPIYEAGTTEDLLFIAMRYVEGRDLKDRLRLGRLDPGKAIGILAQLASALDAAHARGLVHRDVKPSNVLLDPGARPDGSDHVYLADFGLTRRVAEEAGIGDDGHLLGTIDYVAPEQISGEAVDERADVYSLGCVLYECLVGEPLFRRDSDLAVVFAHLETEPLAPSVRRPELPAALDAVVARALAKDPEQRFSSCGELARAALAVAVDEASRRVVDVASRAEVGKSHLREVEAELAGEMTDLELAQEQARALGGPAASAHVATEGICPFKGLASFEPGDAEYFFGRERLVAELVARLVGAGFLGIVGPSGSGKSSVLCAGLLPALAGGMLPGSEGWRRLLLRPGERPLEELRRVLVSGAENPLVEALDTLPEGTRLLLAVDQLEELVTACRSDAEREEFADALVRAAADREGRAVVVVALRADFYGRFAAFPGLAELLGGNQVLVGPMQAAELRRAVELPAGRVGLRVEPELADALVDDVEGEPGALPLLSTALLELWQKRQGDALTLATYRESGGVHGAVARLAESTYARIPDERKPIVRALMLRLVGEDEGDAPVRRRAALAELDLERNEDAAGVLETLADSRLVTVGEGSVEVAHEALLREWPRLRDWIEEDAEGRRLRRHITQAATDWDADGRDPGELYRGARLAAALDWSTDHAFELNELERQFVTESSEASEKETSRVRRTNRRLRALLVGIAVLLAAAVAGGIFAVVKRAEARDAETAQLAQRLGAQALVEDDLDLSLLLARQAVAIVDSPQTRGYLLEDLLRSPKAIGIMHGPDDYLRAIAVSPDGKTLAVGSWREGLRFFDARTFRPIGRALPKIDWVENLAYSPDGETLAVGGGGYIRLLDARTHEQLAETPVDGTVTRIVFTRDGSRLVVGQGESVDDSISIRKAATLAAIGPPIEPDGFAGTYIAQFWEAPGFALADDRTLVTASTDELVWWDLRSHTPTRTRKIPRGHHALAVSLDGDTVAVGIDGGVQLVDTHGRPRTARGVLAGAPIRLLFSANGKTLVSTGADGAVTLWDVESALPRETLRGHSAAAVQPIFSPDRKTLYTASHDGTAIAWDPSGKRGLGRPFEFTQDSQYRGLGSDNSEYRHRGLFVADGRLIAVGLKKEGIGFWDARTLEPDGAPLLDTGGEVEALALSPDGRTLAAASWKGKVTLWDVASRSLRRGPFGVSSDDVMGVSFSADGTMLATAGTMLATSGGVKLWDVATGAPRGSIGDGSDVGAVAFSPSGPLLAGVLFGLVDHPERAGDVEIWDATQRRLIREIDLDAGPGDLLGNAIAFAPDGRVVASSGLADPFVHLWDVRSGELVRELEQKVGGVHMLEFSPDGSLLAASSYGEPFAVLLDVASGEQIGPKLTAGSIRSMIDFSPDGHYLLQTHSNGKGAVWDVDPASWARRACELAGRTLTHKEWEKFLPGRPYEPACQSHGLKGESTK
jgi:WD40 repeat protein/tRNA A-37 threonylcarbamoyl transferase component Bud32